MISIEKGDTVAGKYRVERLIHNGGRSLVLEASDLESASRVVLRLPGRHYSESNENLSGFRDAARHAALLRGDRAERPLDVGALDTGEPFMTTPLLEGTDLGTKLEKSGGLDVLEAIDVVIQTCEIMADAHASGVLHCDLRPAKLFVGTSDDGRSVTVLMSLISVLYDPMAPLRAPFGLDCRTDIYSLGITLCVLLAGKLPLWRSRHTSPSGRSTFVEEYIPLRVTRPELSPDLASIIEKASHKNSEDRYESMASFALALAPYAPGRSQNALHRLSTRTARR